MINSYNQSPPEDPSRLKPSSSTMKMSLWIFTLSVFAQVVGVCIFGVYFHTKVDKIEKEISYHDDYIFLRKIQKCMKEDNVDSSLLSCQEVLRQLSALITEVWHVALRWKEKGYLTTKSEISYINGQLRVEMPGVYYVYSQVSFSSNSAQFLKAPFVQYIYMKRPHETERLLLKGANTFLSQPERSDLHSSQVGGVFTLKKNDSIFVNVTDPSLIDYSPEFTYFGMFKLG
ncbi:hypothetical protein GDO78_013420 [Eleutherodactylus coqui]|uniref:CD40 ligand n=1 Tax=Eleutherodactylus coqui TaxID=57060 RepID=A0A8J6EYE1_ELECQ|nr:hypothetical protein GDO78_013420 [Eleutherodactylus coqui]